MLVRFMDENEFRALMKGETLVNTTDWSIDYHSGCKGFCFSHVSDMEAYEKMYYLLLWNHIRHNIAVAFDDNNNLTRSYGTYGNLSGIGSTTLTEYCTTQYSIDTMHVIGAWDIMFNHDLEEDNKIDFDVLKMHDEIITIEIVRDCTEIGWDE